MRKSKYIFVLIIVALLVKFNNVYAKPSNIVVLYKGDKYYAVKAEPEEIPKGFKVDKLSNTDDGVDIEAYKNGPLTLVKIADENYNYRFIAMDENRNYKTYELITEKINGKIYYIIPYIVDTYKQDSNELQTTWIMHRGQITAVYSSKNYEYGTIILYAVNSDGEISLVYYEDDKYKLLKDLKPKTEEKVEDSTVTDNQDNPSIQDENITIEKQQENASILNYWYDEMIIICIGVAVIITLLILLKKIHNKK